MVTIGLMNTIGDGINRTRFYIYIYITLVTLEGVGKWEMGFIIMDAG